MEPFAPSRGFINRKFCVEATNQAVADSDSCAQNKIAFKELGYVLEVSAFRLLDLCFAPIHCQANTTPHPSENLSFAHPQYIFALPWLQARADSNIGVENEV